MSQINGVVYFNGVDLLYGTSPYISLPHPAPVLLPFVRSLESITRLDKYSEETVLPLVGGGGEDRAVL